MAFSDSSVATITTGSVITARVSDAQSRAGLPQTGSGGSAAGASMFRPMKLMKKPRPNRPNTMEGTPARLLTAPRMMRVTSEVRAGVFRQVDGRDDADRNHEERHHE